MFDAVALDYKSVKVIVDATAAATPEIHAGLYSSYTKRVLDFFKLLHWLHSYLLVLVFSYCPIRIPFCYDGLLVI